MIKQLNKLLKLVGFNLVRAKRTRKAGYRSHIPIEDANTGRTAPLSDYMGDAEWQSTPPRPPYTAKELSESKLEYQCNQPHPFNDGITHFVGDDCPGGHRDVGCDDHKLTRVEQPNSDNKISGPTS